MSRASGRVIYGGSFNPPHIGHMRLAIECLERLAYYAGSLEFLPCAAPPHKDARGLLPFDLRVAMLRAAIGHRSGMSCNIEESLHDGPSYTYETLKRLGRRDDLFFLMGSQDFAQLSQWWHGLRLPEAGNIVVAPRGVCDVQDFLAQVHNFWPTIAGDSFAIMETGPNEPGVAVKLATGGKIIYLPTPRLEISSSRIRELWLAGKNVDYLAPGPVVEKLNQNERAARACWE